MKRVLLIMLVLLSSSLYAQEVLEKIVAVVDNELILKSDLENLCLMEASQKNLDPKDPGLREKVLKGMIDKKLLIAKANIDTIKVSDEEVKADVENRLAYFLNQYGSRENFERAAQMPYEKFKKFMLEQIRKDKLVEGLIQEKFGKVNVTSDEVKTFFDTYKDSLGMVNERFRIAHIFLNPKTGDRILKAAKDFTYLLLDSLKNGADFATLAKRYSNDPGSASRGGDLGENKRGVFFPEFEAAAFALAPNQFSDVIKTQEGYHIIQLLERKGEVIHCRHILIKPKSDDKNDLETIQFLSDIRDSIMTGKNTFEYYARKYSDDKNSKRRGGEIGLAESQQLEKSMLEQLVKMKDGDVGFPKRLDTELGYGFHILKLIKKTPQHKANLETDYDDIKNLCIQKKKNDLIEKYYDELRKSIYWEIRQ